MQVKIGEGTDFLDMIIMALSASAMEARKNARILVTPGGNTDMTVMEMEDLKVPVEDADFIINCLCELREYRKKEKRSVTEIWE